MGTLVEVTVRAFYTSDQADVAPSIKLVMSVERLSAIDHPPKWGELVDYLKCIADDAGITGLRSMTAKEVARFRRHETDMNGSGQEGNNERAKQ